MPSLVVGGVTIPVAISSPSWSRMDATDRGRVFDNTLFVSQTGGAAREWDFETPPVTTALADSYIAVLGSPAAKLCSGDILQLPTMCSPELPGGTPVRKSVGHNVVLRFRLHEIQPAKVLLRYAPGDTITGESFSRSTIATYFDAGGILRDAAINVKRDGHYGPYDAPDRTKRMLLLEDARTNHILWASDFSNAAWVKTTLTVTPGVSGMRSGSSGNTLTATAADSYVRQVPAAGSSIVRTNSIWARRRTGTGQVELYAADGATYQILNLTAGFKRFTVTDPANTGREWQLVIRTSGDAIDVENAQVEDGAFASSEIQTTTAAVTRAADSYSLPFTTPPQEMTVYAKFVEGGTIFIAGARLVGITAAVEANPELLLYAAGSRYNTYHSTAIASVASAAPTAPALGDVVEVNGRLFGDGSVDITQSINAGAAATATQSAANALATAWGGLFVWLNSAGTSGPGFTAIQSLKIVAGARSLAEMRAL